MNGDTNRTGMGTGLPFPISRNMVIGLILVVALLAFELFNYDTTQYALANLLGDVNFVGLRWASILAFAFCAIDFAGLAHLFTPERGRDEPKEIWYLMGAWLLGATMNALMTWWAVSLTLLTHNFGNEVLSREQLLNIVPVFVAVLVWLTRILFIGALSMAGDTIFTSGARPRPNRELQPSATGARPAAAPPPTPVTARPVQPAAPRPQAQTPPAVPVRQPTPEPAPSSRVRRRPPLPGSRPVPSGMQARGRER